MSLLEKLLPAYYQDKWFKKTVTVFPILCYEYDGNTMCQNYFIVIHSLAHRLGHCETILFTLGYYKAVILLLLCNQCRNRFTYKFEFFTSFHFDV